MLKHNKIGNCHWSKRQKSFLFSNSSYKYNQNTFTGVDKIIPLFQYLWRKFGCSAFKLFYDNFKNNKIIKEC